MIFLPKSAQVFYNRLYMQTRSSPSYGRIHYCTFYLHKGLTGSLINDKPLA